MEEFNNVPIKKSNTTSSESQPSTFIDDNGRAKISRIVYFLGRLFDNAPPITHAEVKKLIESSNYTRDHDFTAHMAHKDGGLLDLKAAVILFSQLVTLQSGKSCIYSCISSSELSIYRGMVEVLHLPCGRSH
jgi:hypothetical protein